MNATLQDLTCGPLKKQILLFSLPLIASNVLQVLFNVADVAVAGRFAGAEALGSVGSTTLLVALFVGILLGIGSGINAIVARCCGAGDGRSVSESVQASFLVALFVGLLFLVLGIISAEPVLTLLGTKDVLIEGAVLYFRIYSIGFPARGRGAPPQRPPREPNQDTLGDSARRYRPESAAQPSSTHPTFTLPMQKTKLKSPNMRKLKLKTAETPHRGPFPFSSA